MGRRLNISIPSVINTELRPLTTSFSLETNASVEQWYYENWNRFAPNRSVTPLLITPKIEVLDQDTDIQSTAEFSIVNWYVTSWESVLSIGRWVRTQVVDTWATNPSADYVIQQDFSLRVNKNNPDATHAIIIECEATYIDPRDSGTTYVVQDKVTLTTNRDATAVYPTIHILAEPTQMFNPLTDSTSLFTFNATQKWPDPPYGMPHEIGVFEWYGIKNGNEVKINTLPCYVSGQNTSTLVIDAMYGEEIYVVLRLKETLLSTELLPMKETCSVLWRIPPIDSIVVSKNGGAVRSIQQNFEFTTIVNTNGATISDEKKSEHLRFKWLKRQPQTTTQTLIGWGMNAIVPSNLLQNHASSTHISNEVYLLGAYEEVTFNNKKVTYGGNDVYGRNI